MSQVGSRVLILSPDYIAGEIGVAIAEEVGPDNAKSGSWLVRIARRGIVVALLPQEMVWLDEAVSSE